MESLRKLLKKVFFPGPAATVVCILVTAFLSAYTMLQQAEGSPAAYATYGLSAYTLVILCAGIIRALKSKLQPVLVVLHRNPYVHRYLTDAVFKTHVSLYLSLGINLFFVAMELFYGIRYQSVWFGTLGVYYSTLAAMRFLLLRHIRRSSIGKALVLELKRARLCGIILILMNIALLGVVILVVSDHKGFSYEGYTIYVVAMYAFYNIISAVGDIVRYRKYKSPVLSASKAINLAAALVSMLSMETAMLAQFGAADNLLFRQRMTATTGACICLIVLATAVFMIVQSTIRLNRSGAEQSETEGVP